MTRLNLEGLSASMDTFDNLAEQHAMRLQEQRLWDRFRSNCGGLIMLNRIENLVGTGDPDVEAIVGGIVSKIELKAQETAPARASTSFLGKEGLSSDQRNFIFRWMRNGGRAYILVGHGRGKTAEQMLIDGAHAERVNGYTLTELRAVACARTWPEIAVELGWEAR